MVIQVNNGILEKAKDDNNILPVDVNIDSNVITISDRAFKECRILRSIIIPEGVKNIGNYAFESCYNLRKITLPHSLETIGRSAFEYTKLLEIELPSKIEILLERSFLGSELKRVVLSPNLKTIGECAFEYCEKLSEIIFPDSLETIGDGAFNSCKSLKKVNLPNGLKSMGTFCFAFSGLEEITIPSNTYISSYSFSGCENLKSVKILGSVQVIEEDAFHNCKKLKQLDISNNLCIVQEDAFYGCNNLKISIATSLFYFSIACDGTNAFGKPINRTFDVKELKLYNTKINFSHFEEGVRQVRKKELKDIIDNILKENNILEKECYNEEQHNTFIMQTITKLENVDAYNYRHDLRIYMANYLSKYRQVNEMILPEEPVYIENKEEYNNKTNNSTVSSDMQINSKNDVTNVETVSKSTKGYNEIKDKRINMKVEEIPSIYKDIPYSLYEFGKKLDLLDTIKEIKSRIDIYLKNNNITDKKYFSYTKHEGFIREMLDCIHNDSNYNYIYALNNYMKYVTDVNSKVEVEEMPKTFNVIENDTELTKDDEILRLREEIEKLKQEMSSSYKNNIENDTNNISLEKPKSK